MPDNWIGRRLLTGADAIYNVEGEKVHDLIDITNEVEINAEDHPILSGLLSPTIVYIGRTSIIGSYPAGFSLDYTATEHPDYAIYWGNTYAIGYGYCDSDIGGTGEHIATGGEYVINPDAVAHYFTSEVSWYSALTYVNNYYEFLDDGGSLILALHFDINSSSTRNILWSTDLTNWVQLGSSFYDEYIGSMSAYVERDISGGFHLTNSYSGGDLVIDADFDAIHSMKAYGTVYRGDETRISRVIIEEYREELIIPATPPPAGSPNPYKVIADAT